WGGASNGRTDVSQTVRPRDSLLSSVHRVEPGMGLRGGVSHSLWFPVGLAIAIGFLVLLTGFANAMVSRLLWFPVKGGLWVYFQQVDHEPRGRARPPADRGRFVPLFSGWRIGGGIPDRTASVRHRRSVGGGLISAPRPSTSGRSDHLVEPGLSGVVHAIASGDLPTPCR